MLYINFSQLARDKLVDWYQSPLLVTGVQKRYIWNYKLFPSKSDNEPFAIAAPHFFHSPAKFQAKSVSIATASDLVQPSV